MQAFLALVFTGSGLRKLGLPHHRFVQRAAWAADIPPAALRGIGVVELIGAAGVILPELTGILPALTPAAAAGLALVMMVATTLHLRRGEYAALPLPAALMIAAIIVAIGRL